MTTFQIIGLYTALYVIFGIFLTFRVIEGRFGTQVSIGDGGNESLSRRIRAHGNFFEYAPMMLIALIVMAMLNASQIILHIFGALFLIGRVLHFIGMSSDKAIRYRQVGMVTTLMMLLLSALYILYLILILGPI